MKVLLNILKTCLLCISLYTVLREINYNILSLCKPATTTQGRPGGAGGGGEWYTSIPEKNSPKYTKIPTIHPNIPKIIPRYTLYLKFKESDIPNTRI